MAHFVDDVVLPSQVRPLRPTRPEKRLMLAVLEDALMCIAKHPLPSPDGYQALAQRRRSAREEALGWLADDDVRWPCSFRNICTELDFDPDWIRRQVSQLIDRHVFYRRAHAGLGSGQMGASPQVRSGEAA